MLSSGQRWIENKCTNLERGMNNMLKSIEKKFLICILICVCILFVPLTNTVATSGANDITKTYSLDGTNKLEKILVNTTGFETTEMYAIVFEVGTRGVYNLYTNGNYVADGKIYVYSGKAITSDDMIIIEPYNDGEIFGRYLDTGIKYCIVVESTNDIIVRTQLVQSQEQQSGGGERRRFGWRD